MADFFYAAIFAMLTLNGIVLVLGIVSRDQSGRRVILEEARAFAPGALCWGSPLEVTDLSCDISGG
jgi:hypothetical protein